MTIRLSYLAGTISVEGLGEEPDLALPPSCRWDARTACHRAPALAYPDIVLALTRNKVPFTDDARRYGVLEDGARIPLEPRPYQQEALEAWRKARGRGVVVLPTGAGKTRVAMLAIDDKRRDTLVIAPTLDLVRQWYEILRETFGVEVGVIGGGDHEVRPLTVATYDSAHLHAEHLGARFGLVVFDECHHLPGPAYALAARLSLAPYRLGLSATPERVDGQHTELDELIGPTVYRREIVDLSGDWLADYDVEQIDVELSPEERAEYEETRAEYRSFCLENRLRVSTPEGWGRFLMLSARDEAGRRALLAYRRQKDLSRGARAKLVVVEKLLEEHRADRTLVFTDDNATAYRISREMLVPVITHQTKVKERSEILAGLKDGTYTAVVTSRVLNEGIDLPDVNVAVVVSGSGSVREHVQRLGRILRPREGKRAKLYELVTAETGEAFTSERRRDHVAYR